MTELQKEIYITSLVVLIALLSILWYQKMSIKDVVSKLISVDFEVYGRVQGVFFRKHTEKQSNNLGLRGWCMNTEKGTVQGTIQGDEPAVRQMKQWLKSTGSPQSRIDKCEFSNEKEIKSFTFQNFQIRR